MLPLDKDDSTGMLNKEILFALIDELGEYCKNNHQDMDIDSFLRYTYIKRGIMPTQTRQVGGDQVKLENRDVPAEDLGKLLGMMGRYAKHYFKIAFEGSAIQSAEEFTYLMVLFTYNTMLQSELIKKNAMEKNTGNEIIKRLIRLGLVNEAPKIDDKRAKPILISEKGKMELMKVLPKMRLVGQVISGNLSSDEREMLIYLLSKLDHFHYDLYEKKDLKDLNDYLYKG